MKFNIKENKELPLLLHFYSVTSSITPLTKELKVIVAYTDEEAMDTIKREYPNGTSLAVIKNGQLPVQNILDVVNMEDKTVMPVAGQTKQQFINGLTMAANEYIKDKKDQNTIKKILGKIQ